MPPPKRQEHDASYPLPRVSMNLEIPLWGVMGVVGSGALVAAFMYFQLAQLREDVQDLKAVVKAGNTLAFEQAKEQAITKFRLDKLEAR